MKVFITGASSGIGEALAAFYAARGATLGLVARRGELIGDGVDGSPIADTVAGARTIARTARVRFSGVIVVLPDDDVATVLDEIGKVRGTPVAVVARSALQTVLRRGLTGARDIGGNELFDIRTRLQQAVRFV